MCVTAFGATLASVHLDSFFFFFLKKVDIACSILVWHL